MYARQTCTILLQTDVRTKATGSRGGIAPTHTPEQEEPAGTALYNSPTTFSISSNPRCCNTRLAGAAQSSQLKATLTPKKPCTQLGDSHPQPLGRSNAPKARSAQCPLAVEELPLKNHKDFCLEMLSASRRRSYDTRNCSPCMNHSVLM